MVTAVIAFLMLLSADADSHGQDRLLSYLRQQGLLDLAERHLEDQLAESPAGARAPVAASLRETVAQRLLRLPATDRPERARLLERLNTVSQEYALERSDSVDLVVARARYLAGQRAAERYRLDPRQKAVRDTAMRDIQAAAPVLERLAADLTKQAAEREDKLVDRGLMPESDTAYRQLANQAGQAAFFSAWAHYYQGFLTEGSYSFGRLFAKARERFQKFVGKSPAELDPSDMAYQHLARSVIGLALIESEMGQPALANQWLDLIQAPYAKPPILDEVDYWRLYVKIEALALKNAVSFARTLLDKLSSSPTPGTVGLCQLVVRLCFLDADPVTAGHRQLGLDALGKLVALGQSPVARDLLQRFDILLDESSDFTLWILRGEALFERARATSPPVAAAYAEARQALEKALQQAGPAPSGPLPARARLLIAWCWHQEGELARAAPALLAAAQALASSARDDAAAAAFLATVDFEKLAQRPEATDQDRARLLAALDYFAGHFPEHPQAAQATWRRSLVGTQATQDLAQTYRLLNQVAPEDPNYLPAREQLSVVLFRLWQRAHREPQQQQRWAREHRENVRVVLELLARKDPLDRDAWFTTVRLQQVDMALAQGNLREAETHVRDLTRRLSIGQFQVGDLRPHVWLRVIRLHLRQDQLTEGVSVFHAKLAPHDALATYQAAVELAEAVHQQLNAETNDRTAWLRRSARLHGWLREHLAGAPRPVDEATAATVREIAQARLAHVQLELAQMDRDSAQADSAASLFAELSEHHPDNPGYLRGAALAFQVNEQHEQALPYWRKLATGAQPGTDTWYEARYHLIECLATVNPPRARQSWQQLKLLHPDLGGPTWAERFERLESRLAK